MRPRAKILMLIANEDVLGLWRFRIELDPRFVVLAASEPMAALELIAQYEDCRMAMCMDVDHVAILRMAPQLEQVLLFGVKPVPAKHLAHRVVSGDVVAEVREVLRIMAARKRGPMKRHLDYEASPTLRTLLEERGSEKAVA